MPFRITHAVVAALAFIALGVAHAPAQNPGDFPYVAYVVEPDAYIRSGPGRQHYPTGQLPAGYAVEVYRHDDGGWCAIRPPEGSFSLVPIHQLRMIDQRTAEVAADGVVARVGSSLGAQRNAVQVLLERGEAVQLLEPPASGATWVRIAPPAGEFRWIAARRLSRVPPTEAAPRPASNSGWQAQASGQPLVRTNATNAASTRPAGRTIADGWPGAADADDSGEDFSHLNASPAGPPSDEVEIVADSPAALRLAGYEGDAPVTPPAAAGAPVAPPSDPPALIPDQPAAAAAAHPPRVRFRGASDANSTAAAASAPSNARVAELQLKLSQAVVRPPAQWQLGSLREETAAMLAKEQTPAAREEFRDLLDRIATFETIQSRYASLGPAAGAASAPTAPAALAPVAARSPVTPSAPLAGAPNPAITGDSGEVLARVQADLGRTPAGGAAPANATAQAAAPAQALYDAVGTLKPVVSRRQNAPRFALVDDHGDVVTFVTSTPDVNLQPYVGQRIGVRGARGFMPEFRRAHVVASRITPLEEKLVR